VRGEGRGGWIASRDALFFNFFAGAAKPAESRYVSPGEKRRSERESMNWSLMTGSSLYSAVLSLSLPPPPSLSLSLRISQTRFYEADDGIITTPSPTDCDSLSRDCTRK